MNDNILIVDDNKENIKVLGSILRDAGFIVSFAFNGLQAIDVLKANKEVNLILMDIKMPELNGFETCKLIKRNPETMNIPLIFLTAKNDQEDIVEGFKSGGADYITKPFYSKELISRVTTHLNLKQKTDELKETAQNLHLLNATKDKFFSIISHDLKNPFSVLFTLQKMIKKELRNLENQRLNELSSQMEVALDGTFRLLENLLKWSQSQTGHIKYNPRELFLDAFIDKIFHVLKPSALQKKITLTSKIDSELVMFTDQNLLDTIIRNLVSNAIKYTPEGGEVTLTSWKQDQQTFIEVKDNGVGMSSNIINKLFKIDSNLASNPGTAGERGTGLGLILCQEFISKMGGNITVDSTEGKGTNFLITLPEKVLNPQPFVHN
ncbi:MAG: hybrid sensor histidine kinase/response regulator [Bacteroidota bacterium]